MQESGYVMRSSEIYHVPCNIALFNHHLKNPYLTARLLPEANRRDPTISSQRQLNSIWSRLTARGHLRQSPGCEESQIFQIYGMRRVGGA